MDLMQQPSSHCWLSIATNFLGTTDNIPFAIRTNNIERIRVTTSGTVGINITTPGAPLHVYANATDSQLFISGIAPSIRMFNGTVWNSSVFQSSARLGLANQVNDYVVGSAKGDFVIQTVDTVGSIIFSTNLLPSLLNAPERGSERETRKDPSPRLSQRGGLPILSAIPITNCSFKRLANPRSPPGNSSSDFLPRAGLFPEGDEVVVAGSSRPPCSRRRSG